MTGYLIGYDQSVRRLPTVLGWKFDYGLATPCDSFWIKCLWEADDLTPLNAAVRFQAEEDGARVFTGVVDEYELHEEQDGRWLEISGRGMAALLLDNEAEAADYDTASWSEIVRRHVTPYGIQVVGGQVPSVDGFSVAYGSSEWQAVYTFARYHGGIIPYFDRMGRLVVQPWQDTTEKLLDDKTAVTGAVFRYQRYGVLSQVMVRDKTRQEVEQVNNYQFQAVGGQCRRWYTMPGRSSYQAMRYQGQFQLEQSMAGLEELEITVPAPFFAAPGELVRVQRTGRGWSGLWRVAQASTGMDDGGCSTVLTLGRPDLVG